MLVTAKATQSGDWWAIEVPEIPGLFTQVKRLDHVEEEVIDAAAMLGHDVTTVRLEPVLSPDDYEILQCARQLRAEATLAAGLAGKAARQAVHRFREEGVTVRDVAAIMDLSAQRVSVLAREPIPSDDVEPVVATRRERASA